MNKKYLNLSVVAIYTILNLMYIWPFLTVIMGENERFIRQILIEGASPNIISPIALFLNVAVWLWVLKDKK